MLVVILTNLSNHLIAQATVVVLVNVNILLPMNLLDQWFPTFLHRGPVKIFKNVRGLATKDP